MTEDEMVGWHCRLNEYEFESIPGVGDGQGDLVCSSPWGRKELDMTEHMLESRMPGEISITSDMQMTPPLWQKVKKN